MIYPIVSLTTDNNSFSYTEYPEEHEKGAFLFISECEQFIKIRVDRFSRIPFYFICYAGKLYGSTKLHLLLQSLPANFEKKLNILAAVEFLRTNSMIGNKTLIAGIERIPFGHELIFEKSTSRLRLEQYWQLPGGVHPFTENQAVDLLRESFLTAIRDSIKPFDSVGMHLSGGMDSRQILGALLNEKVNLQAFTYGVSQNIDVVVARQLSRKFMISHHYFQWEGVQCFKEHADEHFLLTDGMQALFHGHGIEVHEYQKKNVDTVIYGHFLDLFIQAHVYNPFFENDEGLTTTQKLYETFDGGPCSVLRGDSLEPLMISKAYHGVFREEIYGEIRKFDYMIPEKRYDAVYFIHHGLRRLLPQVQSGAQFLDFQLPGLNSHYFDIAWSIPGRLRKYRKLQEKLLLTLNSKIMKVPVIKDNIIVKYMGQNRLKRLIYDADSILRERRLLLKRYDYYGQGLREMANSNLYDWMKKEILGVCLEQYGFLEPAYLNYIFEDRSFKSSIPVAHYGAMFSLAKFVRSYLQD